MFLILSSLFSFLSNRFNWWKERTVSKYL